MGAQNVVEILVKSTNQTAAGFTEVKASAAEVAAATDDMAAADKRAADAKTDLDAKTAALAEAQQREGATAEEVAAMQAEVAAAEEKASAAAVEAAGAADKVASAQARAAAAAKASGDDQAAASAKAATAAGGAADAQKAQGDAALASGVKSSEAGGLMAGMGSKVKMAGLGVAVGMGLAVKSAMDFQQTSTKWVTSAGENVNQLGMLQQGVLALSSQTATSSTELSNGLYMISSAGITGAGGLNVLKAAAEGAKSEGADLTEVTNALTSGLNAYGMKTKTSAEATVSATSMMNQMLQTVSQGKMTFQELAGSLSAVLPIAAANKVSYADVGGALATMTSMGVSAQQGTQNLAFVIRGLANPTSVATNEMSMFGISSTDVSSKLGQRGLTGTIEYLSNAVTQKMGPSGLVIANAMNQSKSAAADAAQMLSKLPASIQGVAKAYLDGSISSKTWTNDLKAMPPLQANLAKEWANVANQSHSFNNLLKSGSPAAQTYAAAMSKLLGGATGLNVGLMLTGSHAATVEKNVKAIAAASNGASGQVSGFSDVTKETSFQMAKAGDSIKAAGTSLGLALLPAVNAVLTPLASFFSMLSQNKAAAIAFAVVIGGVLAGAIGTKAVHAVTEFKGAVETTIGGIEKLVGKITGLGSAQEKAAAVSKKASAEAAAAAEESAAKEEEAWAASAVASEEAAGEAAAAQETAAGESSDAWAWMAKKTEPSFTAVEESAATSAEGAAAANEEAAAASSGSWLRSAASAVGSAAKWVAQGIAKVAVVVASNIAGAAVTAAAWVAANAVMLLGIGLVVAAVAIAVYEIVTHWKTIVHGVEEAWNAVYKFVSGIVADVVSFVKSHWMLLLGILLGPIALAVAAFITYRKQIVSVFEGLWHDVTSTVSRLASDVLHFFEQMFSAVTSTERRAIAAVIADVRGWFSEWLSMTETGLGNVVHWFEGLPGRIVHALGDVGSLLLHAGESIIQGLINGITNMVGAVTGTVSNVVNDIKSFLPFSPAKRGPLSGSGSPENSGKSIARLLASGISSGAPAVRQAMQHLTGNAAASSSGSLAIASGAAAGGAAAKVTFDFSGAAQDPFVKAVRQAVRILGGGNVQKAFGSGTG
jgi:hypothetical protein